MEKLLKYFLSLLIIFCFACDIEHLSIEERKKRAAFKWQEFLDGGGYHQGSPANMKAITEILKLDPNHCDALRERSIPYLKRGMPEQWKKYMDQAVACDSTRWIGWRGYLYLYFYRDYAKAIADFDATDTLTPQHIDAPQGHSVDYWRGHAYLGAKNYEKSLFYYNKHIEKVTADFGEDWVEPDTFLNIAIAHYENQSIDSMPHYLDKALYYYQDKNADSKYYYALYQQAKGNSQEALEWVDKGIKDFFNGHSKERPYIEEIKQVYVEQLIELEKALKNPTKR